MSVNPEAGQAATQAALQPTPPAATQSAPRPKPVKIDWKAAARMLAEGVKPPAIAATLGIPEDRFWRHLTRSARFRFYIWQEIERHRLLAELDCGRASRESLVSASSQPGGLDAEILKWLGAAGAGFGQEIEGSAEDASRETRREVARETAKDAATGAKDLVNRLGRTGRLPPGKASQQLLHETQKAKDAFVARLRADIEAAERQIERDRIRRRVAALATMKNAAARAAAGADPAGPPPSAAVVGGPDRSAAGSSGPQRSEMGSSGHQRSEMGSSGPQRSEMGSSGHQRSAVVTGGPQRSVVDSSGQKRTWTAAWTPPLHEEGKPPPSRASIYRAIIDLPGPDNPE